MSLPIRPDRRDRAFDEQGNWLPAEPVYSAFAWEPEPPTQEQQRAAFEARMTGDGDDDGPAVIEPQCRRCELLVESPYTGERHCAAFPGGIPTVIWLNVADHSKPYDGDFDIRFTPVTPATKGRRDALWKRFLADQEAGKLE